MRYLLLPLLVVIISQLSSYVTFSLTSEDIENIAEVYHNAIRSHPGLALLTDIEIESALKHILAEENSQSMSSEQIMQCQPRPHIINEDEIKMKLNEQSLRVRTTRGPFSARVRNPHLGTSDQSSCLMLHRCHKYGGCCRGRRQSCDVSASERVSIDITVRTRQGTFVETLSFLNHTECSCQRPTVTDRCSCPHPFKDVSNNNNIDRPCNCQCKPGLETQCQQITSGRQSISWRQSQISDKFDGKDHYEICYNDSRDNTWNRRASSHSSTTNYCPPINCAAGLIFNVERLKCVRNPSSSQSTQSNQPTEYRTIRDIEPSDYNNLELPDLPESTTPKPSGILSKRLAKSKTKRRIEKKLTQIQKKGLKNSISKSQIARKIFQSYEQFQNQQGSSPRDLIINLPKQSTQVSCNVIPKDDYHVFPLESDFLFCSVDVS